MKSPTTDPEAFVASGEVGWTADKIWEALCWGQEGYPQWGTEGYRQWRKRFDKLAELINKELETAKREHAKQFAAEREKLPKGTYGQAWMDAVDEIEQLRKQLAAEQEAHKQTIARSDERWMELRRAGRIS